MVMTDPIADMLTRIRNAAMAHKDEVILPASTVKQRIAEILVNEGYIAEASVSGEGKERAITPAAEVRFEARADHHRSEARLHPGPACLRREGRHPEGVGRPGHRYPVHIERRDDGPPSQETGRGRRSHRLRLVNHPSER